MNTTLKAFMLITCPFLLDGFVLAPDKSRPFDSVVPSQINPFRLQHSSNQQHLRPIYSKAEGEDEPLSKIPALPPPTSVSPSSDKADKRTIKLNGDAKEVGFVSSRKFQLSYTCKICNTVNKHMINRIAYNNGVVIATCKGCKNKHMIADNLNYYPGTFGGSTNNIEEYMEKQQSEEMVQRVTKEVWDLEDLFHHNSPSDSYLSDIRKLE